MRAYTLPEPSVIELGLLRRLSGSARRPAVWKTFPSGEIHVRVSGVEKRVCLIGRTTPPADNFFRTLLLADTLRRNGAEKITLVLPYLAYARQDRQTRPGDPLSTACLSRALASAGVGRVVTLDLHSRRNIESSPIPIENVSIVPDMARSLAAELKGRDVSVVAADFGGRERADDFARTLGLKGGAVWIEKRRDRSGKASAKRLVGSLAGRTAVIVDDILDTGGTISEAARLLKKHGCRDLYLCVVHPVFSAGAARLIKKLKFRRVLVSDAFPATSEVLRLRNVRVVSAAAILAKAVL